MMMLIKKPQTNRNAAHTASQMESGRWYAMLDLSLGLGSVLECLPGCLFRVFFCLLLAENSLVHLRY